MHKIRVNTFCGLLAVLFLFCSCRDNIDPHGYYKIHKNIWQDEGEENELNADNVIYIGNRVFTYSYTYEDSSGKPYRIVAQKDKECKDNCELDWKLIPEEEEKYRDEDRCTVKC